MAKVSPSSHFKDIQGHLENLKEQKQLDIFDKKDIKSDSPFYKLLKENIHEVNRALKDSDRGAEDVVSGKSSNLHETMLGATRAELAFQLLVQMRNKALDAYQEIMRMQV